MRKLLALLLALPLLGGCAVWGPEGGPNGAGIPRPSAVATTETATDAILGADGVQRVTITVTDKLRFEPSEVRAKVGTIEFTIRNTGGSPHTFGVGADKLDNINGGETRTLRVTVDRPGSYPYPCAYHGSVGMRGTLDVR